jgi:hypothetical protein
MGRTPDASGYVSACQFVDAFPTVFLLLFRFFLFYFLSFFPAGFWRGFSLTLTLFTISDMSASQIIHDAKYELHPKHFIFFAS